MLGKNLGNLEEQGNENLLTFSEMKQPVLPWGHTMGWDWQLRELCRENQGPGTLQGYLRCWPCLWFGCVQVCSGQTLHSALVRLQLTQTVGLVEASPAESQWGAQESASRGCEGWGYLSWRRWDKGASNHSVALMERDWRDDGFRLCHSMLENDKAVVMHCSKGNLYMEKILRTGLCSTGTIFLIEAVGPPSLRFIRKELERPSTTFFSIETAPALNMRLNWSFHSPFSPQLSPNSLTLFQEVANTCEKMKPWKTGS